MEEHIVRGTNGVEIWNTKSAELAKNRKGSERNTLTADISCDSISVYDISSSAVMDGDILDWKIEIGGEDEWK
jgi:nitrous oxidase accessory protein NosD